MTKVKDKMEIFKEVIESYPDSILKCITEKYNSSPDYINHLLIILLKLLLISLLKMMMIILK